MFQKTKKLSNRKRKLGNGNLGSLKGEVVHTHACTQTHTHTKKEYAQLA